MFENLMCGLLGGTVAFVLDIATAPKDEDDDTELRRFGCLAVGVATAVVVKKAIFTKE